MAKFLGFPRRFIGKTPMTDSLLTTESFPHLALPLAIAPPFHCPLQPRGDHLPVRHLLIGSPDVVQLTIHRLHNLGYAEAGLWSPAIAFSGKPLVLTLNPHEVMRVLVRYVRSVDEQG
jgi:hypothetical protein